MRANPAISMFHGNRVRSAFRIFAAGIVVSIMAPGCGGGGSTSSNSSVTRSLTGIWSGTFTPNSSTALTMEMQLVQSGTSITGVERILSAGQPYTANVTGSVNGNSVTLSADFGVDGIVTGTQTISGNVISGSYTRTLNGQTSTGTDSITFQSGLATSLNVGGNYTGTGTSSQGTTNPLSITVTQSGNQLNLTGTSGTGANLASFTGTGLVIGNHVTFINQQSTSTIYIDGTISGATISGTALSPGTNPGQNGVSQTSTFTLTKS